MRLSIILLIFALHTQLGLAQDSYRYGITHRFTLTDFNNNTKNSSTLSRGMEVNLSRWINRSFSLNLPIKMGFSKGVEDTVSRIYYATDFQIAYGLPNYKISPYISTGVGLQYLHSKWSLGLPIFSGLNIAVDKTLMLNFQGGYRLALNGESTQSYWQYGIGLQIKFGDKLQKKVHLNNLTDSSKLLSNNTINNSTDSTQSLIASRNKTDSLSIHKQSENMGINTHINPVRSISLIPIRNLANVVLNSTFANLSKPRPSSIIILSGMAIDDKRMAHIYFDYNKLSLTEYHQRKLDSLILTFKSNHFDKVDLHGYADSIGSDKNNLTVSRIRATNCYQYLIKKGIKPKQINITAHGESNPRHDNSSVNGRALNRRVDIFLK